MILSLKRVALFCLMSALLGVAFVWGVRLSTIAEESDELGLDLTCPLVLTITSEKNTYKVHEPITMTITLKNVGEEKVTILFTTRPNPNPHWFSRVYDENNQLVFYHKVMLAIPSLEEITLQPNEIMQRNCTWDQKDTNNEQQVPPGIYYLIARVGFMYNEEVVLLQTQTEISIET